MCANADEHRDNKGQDLRNDHKCKRRYDIRHKQLPSVHRKRMDHIRILCRIQIGKHCHDHHCCKCKCDHRIHGCPHSATDRIDLSLELAVTVILQIISHAKPQSDWERKDQITAVQCPQRPEMCHIFFENCFVKAGCL